MVEELVGLPDAVLATGGGTVVREANRAALQRGSTAVYLRATPEELFRRLRHDTQRPLLQVNDPLRRLRDLYLQRDPLYRDDRALPHRDRPAVDPHAGQHDPDAARARRRGRSGACAVAGRHAPAGRLSGVRRTAGTPSAAAPPRLVRDRPVNLPA